MCQRSRDNGRGAEPTSCDAVTYSSIFVRGLVEKPCRKQAVARVSWRFEDCQRAVRACHASTGSAQELPTRGLTERTLEDTVQAVELAEFSFVGAVAVGVPAEAPACRVIAGPCYPSRVFPASWIIVASLALQSAQPPPSATWTDDQPITHVLQNLGHDLKALAGPDTVLIAAAGLGTTGLFHPADDNVADWAKNAGPSSYVQLGSVIGNEWFQGGVAVATYAAGRLGHSDEAAHLGSDLIRAQLLNGVITSGLKLAVDRTRPNGGPWAFPSGHTSASFASAAVLTSHYGWRAAIPSYLAASFIAWTRVRGQEHWLTDVIAGGTIGEVAGITVSAHGRHTWLVSPSLVDRGFFIEVVKIKAAK
jgi:membrane-associated phospholipid phosphatase